MVFSIKGTSTNENGEFQLLNLPNNPVKIHISYIGYETQIKTIHLQTDKTILNIVFLMMFVGLYSEINSHKCSDKHQ